MKSLFKNPFFYANIVLLVVVGFLMTSIDVNQLKAPSFVKKVLAQAQSILGSGTVNYLSAFTASNQIGNSIIFDNGTNIGIGMTNPTAKLEVNGVIKTQSGNISIGERYTAPAPGVISDGYNMGVKIGGDFHVLDSSANAYTEVLAQDYWIQSISKWASQLGGGGGGGWQPGQWCGNSFVCACSGSGGAYCDRGQEVSCQGHSPSQSCPAGFQRIIYSTDIAGSGRNNNCNYTCIKQ